MKKILIYSTASIILFLTGCASTAPVPAAAASTDYTTSTKPAKPTVPADVPNWFMETPSEDDQYYYATAVSDMRSMGNAINRAIQDGQRQLSESIKANVQSMVKNYTQEAGVNETANVIEFYESVSKTVSDNVIAGLITLKKYPYEKPGGGYKAYVLVGIQKDAVQNEVLSQIQTEESMYAEFKASQAFQALEAEVNK